MDRIASLPGVESASTATVFYGGSLVAEASDAAASEPGSGVTVALNSVTSDYFATTRIRLLTGRPFAPGDREGAPPVAIVSESVAKRLWPGEDPIGKRVLVTESALEVVGVVADNRGRTLVGEDYPLVYLPLAQAYGPFLSIHVRSLDPSVPKGVAGILADLDPDLPVWTVSLSRLVADSLWAERTAAALLSLFGSVALALCGVGLFAMVAFNASQRTRELAIRSALGASRRALAATVGREAAFLVGAGIAIGSGVLIALGRFAKSFLHEVSPTDPASLAATALLLSMVSAAACLAPLRRAATVDPAVALRSE